MSSDTGSEDSFQVVESMNPEAHRDSKMEGDSPVKTSPQVFRPDMQTGPAPSSSPGPNAPFPSEAKLGGTEPNFPLSSPHASHSGQGSQGSVDVNLSQASGIHSPRGEETSSAPPDVSYYRQGFSEFGSPSEHSEPSGLHRGTAQAAENSPDASTLFQSIDANQSFPQQGSYGFAQEGDYSASAEGGYVQGGESKQVGMGGDEYGVATYPGGSPTEISNADGQAMGSTVAAGSMGDGTADHLFGGSSGSAGQFEEISPGHEDVMHESGYQHPAEQGSATLQQTGSPGFNQEEGFTEGSPAESSGSLDPSAEHNANDVFGDDSGFVAFSNGSAAPLQDVHGNTANQNPEGIPTEFQSLPPAPDASNTSETANISAGAHDAMSPSAAAGNPFLSSDQEGLYPPVQSAMGSEGIAKDTTQGPMVATNTEQANDEGENVQSYVVQEPLPPAEQPTVDVTDESQGTPTSSAGFPSSPTEEKGSPSIVPGFDNLRVDTAPPRGETGSSPVPAAANLFGSSSVASGSPIVGQAPTPLSGGTPTASTLFAAPADESENASAFPNTAPGEALFDGDRARQKSVSSAASDFFDGIDESKKLGRAPEQVDNIAWQTEEPQSQVHAHSHSDYEYPPGAESTWQEQPPMPQATFEADYNSAQAQAQPQFQPPQDAYSGFDANAGAYVEQTESQQNFPPAMQAVEPSYAPEQSQSWQQDPFQYSENPPGMQEDTNQQNFQATYDGGVATEAGGAAHPFPSMGNENNQQVFQATYDGGPATEAGGASHPFGAEQVGSKSPVEYGIEFAPAVPMVATPMPNTPSFPGEAPIPTAPMHSLPPMAPQPSDASLRSGGEATSLYGERRNDGKPPHAVVSWGFGGRLLVMVPMERMKLKPQLITRGSRDGSNDNISVPRRESIGSTAESVDSETYGSGQGRRRLRKGQVRMFSMRMLMGISKHLPCWDGSEITGFPGPLRGPRSAYHQVDSFIEAKLVSGLRFNDGELVGSTQLLWYILKLYVSGAGDLQREDIVRQIVNVLRTGTVQLDGDRSLQIFQQAPVAGDKVAPPSPAGVDVASVQSQIQELLLAGDREGAVVHAVENELWTEALIISNFVSASAYRKVVARFADKSLVKFSATRAVFRLYAGQGSELVSQESMDKEQLRNSWAEVLACIMSNRTPGDTTVLQLLGDRLWLELGSVSGAHVCYLLAGVPVHGSGRSRIVLVGGDHKTCLSQKLCVVSAAIQMTEIYLYARQLGDQQYGLAPFQGYRLVYAMWLADIGYTEEALQWVESIQEAVDMCVKQTQEPGKLGIGSGFQRQLKIFGDRLKFVGNGYPGSRKQMEPGEAPSFIGKFARFFGQPDSSRGSSHAHGRGSPDNQPTPLQFKPSHTDPFAKPFTRPVCTDKEPEPTREPNVQPPGFGPPSTAHDEQLSQTALPMQQDQGMGALPAGPRTGQPPIPFQPGGPASSQAPPMPPPVKAPVVNKPPGDAKEVETTAAEDGALKQKQGDGAGGSVTTSLFKGLKTITQKIYKPKGHVVDGGMGSDMKAVYDPVKGQWIFPDDPGLSKEEKLKQEQAKAGPPVMAKGPVASLNAPGRPSTAPPVGGNQFRIMPPSGRGKGRRDLSKIRYVDPFKAMKKGNA